MRYTWALSAVAIVGLLDGGTATAGVAITMENHAGGQPSTDTMLIEPDRLRVSGERQEFIYRADLGKVWVVDGERHSYMEMSPDSMRQMRSQADAAMQQMQQQLASMPPEQRKQIEAMMAQRGGMAQMQGMSAPRQITYEKAGGGKTVGKWSCTPYRMSVNGKPESELCIARASDVGVNRDDMKAFISLGAFMEQAMSSPGMERNRPAGAFDFDSMSKAIGFDGIPIQTASYSPDGKTVVQSTIKDIERKNIPASSFELPAGVTKQEMPMGRPPR